MRRWRAAPRAPPRTGRAGQEASSDEAKVAASGREVASNATASATVRASGVGTVDPSAVPGAYGSPVNS